MSIQSSNSQAVARANRGKLFLTFILNQEFFAIDIARVREIIEFSKPAEVPMMPFALRGVINVRGSVVPVVDLALRFGWEPLAVGRRTSIVLVEVEYEGIKQIIGIVVDRVNAVTGINKEEIESPPAFGARLNTEFIQGMARMDGRFVILLDLARTLSIDELAEIGAIPSSESVL